MNIGSATSTPIQAPEAKRAELQMLLLKKTLQAQQDQATELLKQIEGKGQTIDLKV